MTRQRQRPLYNKREIVPGTFRYYVYCLGKKESHIATEATALTGVTVTWEEVTGHSSATPESAEALAQYLSQQYGRTLTVRDLKGLRIWRGQHTPPLQQ